ncbi:hypothetical protein BDC45DRAFT_77445 [Circinella umbellata]|nr:hypothetical protein BDC45DRAFT_77445 [Circinella umbellata]
MDGKKQHDVANCEFAKNGNLLKKIVTDNIKLIGEAKCIMDFLVHIGRLDESQAREVKVVNLQACGLKMQLVLLKLDMNGDGYAVQSVGKTIRFPHSREKIGDFFDVALPQLYYLKVSIHDV